MKEFFKSKMFTIGFVGTVLSLVFGAIFSAILGENYVLSAPLSMWATIFTIKKFFSNDFSFIMLK